MKSSAWQGSFGGANVPMQAQLFTDTVVAKMIRGYSLQEQPALSSWGQTSLLGFWSVLICHYVHLFLSSLPNKALVPGGVLCYHDWISWALSTCVKRRWGYSSLVWICSWSCLAQCCHLSVARSGRVCIQLGIMKQDVGMQNWCHYRSD